MHLKRSISVSHASMKQLRFLWFCFWS